MISVENVITPTFLLIRVSGGRVRERSRKGRGTAHRYRIEPRKKSLGYSQSL